MSVMIAFVLAAGLSAPQVDPDPAKINQAIRRGVNYLKTQGMPGHGPISDCAELKLLTYIHAYPDVSEKDPQLKELLEKVLKEPLTKTYKVSLQAMCLEELDRVRYQHRIAECGQFLIDNQCANGQWTYDGTALPVKFTPAPQNVQTKRKTDKADKASPPERRVKPKVAQQIPLTVKGSGAAEGDNSNSQYAALGLRACHDAGIVLPREVIVKARKHWIDRQIKEPAKAGGRNDVETDGNASYPAAGWNYGPLYPNAWGSMTAGAIGCLCIYDSILDGETKETWKKNPAVRMGMAWMAKHFTVTDNPLRGAWMHYYHLYALERVGLLFGTRTIGTHDWYVEGAKYLLKQQKGDGSWARPAGDHEPVWDTCFAILFLKRATRPLNDVATGSSVRPDVPQER